MGKDIITYTPTTFGDNSGTVKVKINGKEYKATDVQEKIESGFVTTVPKNDPEHKIAYDTSDIDGLCVTNDARTMQLKLAKRKGYSSGVEFQFALNMHEDAMDTRNSGAFGPGGKYGGGYGQICMDGGSGSGSGYFWKNFTYGKPQQELEAQVHDSQRVDYNESWFGAQELGEMCDNLMRFNAKKYLSEKREDYETDMSEVGGCDKHANYMAEQNHKSIHTPEDLCKTMGVSYSDALTTCANMKNEAFKEACVLEFCNDGGDPNAPAIAQGVEEDIEAAEASAEESHHNELNFTPEECCIDDVNCDKTFSLN